MMAIVCDCEIDIFFGATDYFLNFHGLRQSAPKEQRPNIRQSQSKSDEVDSFPLVLPVH